MKLSRRGFLGGIAATVVLPAVALKAVAKTITDTSVAKFGWIEPYEEPKWTSYSELVTTTLQRNKDVIHDNIVDGNALLSRLQQRLDGKDAKKTFRFDDLGPGYDYDRDGFEPDSEWHTRRRGKNVRNKYASQR